MPLKPKTQCSVDVWGYLSIQGYLGCVVAGPSFFKIYLFVQVLIWKIHILNQYLLLRSWTVINYWLLIPCHVIYPSFASYQFSHSENGKHQSSLGERSFQADLVLDCGQNSFLFMLGQKILVYLIDSLYFVLLWQGNWFALDLSLVSQSFIISTTENGD